MIEYCVEYRWRKSIAHPYSRFYQRTYTTFKDQETALGIAERSSVPCRVIEQKHRTIKIFKKEK